MDNNQQPNGQFDHYGNAPTFNQYDPNNQPMRLQDWIISFLLLLIPIVNIILVFMWAFGSNVNKSKKSFFQAYLILCVAGIIFAIIFSSIITALIMAAFPY